MNEKSINLMNILTPEIFNLNKYSETYLIILLIILIEKINY